MKNIYILITACLLMVVAACKKDSSSSTPSGEKVTGTVTGRIFDEAGQAIAGVLVSAGGKTATTDQWGIYVIKGGSFDKNRSIINAEKSGFWKQTGAFHPSSGSVAYSNLTLFSASTTHTFDAATGATLSLSGGAKVTFPANSIATANGGLYSGTVSVTMHELATDAAHFGSKIPGSDLRAINANNEEGALLSYGMLGVVLKDAAGNNLNLKNGATANIIIPIAADQLSSAPATIALWYFDESEGMWKEQGTAHKTGAEYSGSVSHFTWWNCDVWGTITYVDGFVFDCSGNPVANAEVTSSSGGYGETDANGYYSGGIGAGTNVEISAYYDDWNSGYYFDTQIEYINAQAGVLNHVPNLQFIPTECPEYIDGTLVDCAGTPTSGTVVCVDSLMNFVDYIYTTTGSFHLCAYPSTFRVLAYEGAFAGAGIAQVVAYQNTAMGNLPLCDSLMTGNNLQLTFSSQLGTINSSFAVQACNVDTTTTPAVITFMQYDPTTQRYLKIKLRTPIYSPGTYTWNQSFISLEGDMIQGGTMYHLEGAQNASGSTQLTSTPVAGSTVVGSFAGPITLSDNTGISLPGTINASFSIYRNH